jgi:hypothetical protein
MLMLVTAAPAQLNPGCPVQPATLKAMRNCYRHLLIFAPSARDASFISQQALLDEYADDVMDRNLLYVPVLGLSAHFGAPLDAPYVLLKPSEMNAIRGRFQIGASDLWWCCLGKTAARNSGQRNLFSVLKLDDIVDAMQIGRQESGARPAKPQ